MLSMLPDKWISIFRASQIDLISPVGRLHVGEQVSGGDRGHVAGVEHVDVQVDLLDGPRVGHRALDVGDQIVDDRVDRKVASSRDAARSGNETPCVGDGCAIQSK